MARKAPFPPPMKPHATGQARVYWRGRTYYLGKFGSPQAEAAYAALLVRLTAGSAEITEFRNSVISAPTPANSAPAVADVAAAFLAAAEKERSPRSVKAFAMALAPLCRVCGDLPAADFDDGHLERVRRAMTDGSWMNDLEIAGRESRGQSSRWCRTYANRQVSRIATVWRWAERRKLVPRGSRANLLTLPPLKRNTAGVREVPRRRGTSRADLDAVLPHVQRRRRLRPCAAMLELQWLTGMRTGEVCIMRPADIDRETGPSVDGVKVWLYTPSTHKTEHLDKSRVIALGPQAQALLAPWLLSCPGPDAYLFRPAGKRAGPRYTVNAYDYVVWRACRLAGLKLCPYMGRHATKDRVTRAAGLDAARAVLGQTSLGTTNSYGSQLDLEAAARAAAKLG